MLDSRVARIVKGELLSYDEARDIAAHADQEQLWRAADSVRQQLHGNSFDLCSIVNATSGRCSEDCRFCAQSSHYDVDIDSYELVEKEDALAKARDNDSHGVRRLSLVTAGHSVSDRLLDEYGALYDHMAQETDLLFCASMGFLTPEKAAKMRAFGVTRYHCNLEACKEFFPQVCTTHSWEDKVETINIARDAGMEVCSGGIIGMGETVEHRLQLAFELRELQVLSIPINILTPIENTPFAQRTQLSLEEVLTCIAMFRLIHPHAVVRLAGGRSQLAEQQYQCFCSGANGAIVGNYLTTAGNELQQDLEQIRKLGFRFNKGR